ncbi:MAG: hypothetical protein DMF17_08570 [Verrucomicrobia bacterium]|nr:MAG: hypothetical protein DMF17_08570 [Verrucomicrobiota bacterium]
MTLFEKSMSPDKLFDYLDGKLSTRERAELEQRLTSDQQLQSELAVARRIHASMRGDSREVLLPAQKWRAASERPLSFSWPQTWGWVYG